MCENVGAAFVIFIRQITTVPKPQLTFSAPMTTILVIL